MKEMTPVKTPGVSGYYTPSDLVLQMIFYGDITPWRCARIMRIAEEEQDAERKVLLITENASVAHLVMRGFRLYRPAEQGYDKADIDAIITALMAGTPIIIDTNGLLEKPKLEISRKVANALSELSTDDLSSLSFIVESTEQFFARRWNYGEKSGVPVLNNLLKRFKAAGTHVVFGAESPQEIAIEIARSCGTSVVSLTSNNDRAKAIARTVDSRLSKHAHEIYGLGLLNVDEFYLYNRSTAPRQGQMALGLFPDVPVSSQAMTMSCLVPCWLKDSPLACGFDPNDPTKPRLDTDGQSAFVKMLIENRDAQPDAKGGSPSIAATANDNAPRRRSRKTVRRQAPTRFMGSRYVVEQLKAKGVPNAERMVAFGLKAINARGGKLNVPLHGGITAQKLVKRIIEDELLREAVVTAGNIEGRYTATKGVIVSGVSYAAAHYQSLCENPVLARKFHDEMFVAGRQTGEQSEDGINLERALVQLGTERDVKRRTESQYQLLMNAWNRFVEADTPKARKAA